MGLGVSVVVCCHNSAARLPSTLAHLAAQESTAGTPWEVVVVDNASADNSSGVALAEWPVDPPAPLKVVTEPTLGLSHARLRGIEESKYALISFIDDDNWVCPEWVKCVSELMSSHSEVGACGGHVEAVCEVPPPDWFDRYKECFAVGEQAKEAGDVTSERGFLWGAGLTVRKTAMLELLSCGFEFLVTGRQGASLTAGEDSELCCALRLAGWRLWYDPHLRVRHFLPAQRLSWAYLRRVMRGFGASSVGLDGYLCMLEEEPVRVPKSPRRSWLVESFVSASKLVVLGASHPLALIAGREDCHPVLRAEWQVGRLRELIKRRATYGRTPLLIGGVSRATDN